mmetsp:Transcript_10526/g.16002  ORF Transcript_10526/g.16002 Transcript_10526/m.16002 type:complete len:81 (-) Transcript_10526:15-257(-)
MAVFSVTDILISITLITNGLALISPDMIRVSPGQGDTQSVDYISQTKRRLQSLMLKMRKLSCLIAVWNVFFLLLMVFVFS